MADADREYASCSEQPSGPQDCDRAIGGNRVNLRRLQYFVWMELAERMAGRHDQKALADSVASDRFVRATSDERFAITFAALAPRKPKAPRPTTWIDDDGKKIVKIERHADRVTLALDEKAAPAFGDFVISRLPELYRAFREGRTDE